MSLSTKTRELFCEFAYYKGQGDNSSATIHIWRDALLSAFNNGNTSCDAEIGEILKSAGLEEDDITGYVNEYESCMWILQEQSKN